MQFVAARERIAPDQLELAGEETITFPLLEQTYRYITIFHTQPETTQVFSLFVDPVTKIVEPDVNTVRDAERTAHRARYGKLEPALYERLQQIGDEESIPVAIWAAHHEVERSFEEIVDILITRYPAAETAWKETGIFWAVDDAELAVEIQVEFERLLTENINLRSAAMIDWLRAEGFAAEPISGMPVISVKLPKRVILALNEREDVARIYAFDAEAVPASDIAPFSYTSHGTQSVHIRIPRRSVERAKKCCLQTTIA